MYIRQIGTNIIVHPVSGGIDYSHNMNAHPALVEQPTLFELVDEELPVTSETLVYHGRSLADIQRAYKEAADELIQAMNEQACVAGVSGAQGADVLDQYSNIVLYLREGHFGLALLRISQKPLTGFTVNDTDLRDVWANLIQTTKDNV